MSYVNILRSFLAGRKMCTLFFGLRKIVCISQLCAMSSQILATKEVIIAILNIISATTKVILATEEVNYVHIFLLKLKCCVVYFVKLAKT